MQAIWGKIKDKFTLEFYYLPMKNVEKFRSSLTALLTGAGATMVALTSIAHVTVLSSFDDLPSDTWNELLVMIAASGTATIFVLGLLHSDLYRHFSQITHREDLARLEARRDPLTGLPNRKALLEALEEAVASIQASNAETCMAILDLDQFKSVNDTLGHEYGDELLKQVAARLTNSRFKGNAYRLGGDEFAIVIQDCGLVSARSLCQELCNELEGTYVVNGAMATIGCSIGIAPIEAELNSANILRHADLAMYRAKLSRNSVATFDQDMFEELNRKEELAYRLRQAIESKTGISARFQPVFTPSKRISSLEGLLRWNDEIFGTVDPRETIDVARSNNTIDLLSIKMAKDFFRFVERDSEIMLRINVEAIQLARTKFIDELALVIEAYRARGGRLQLEIQEADFLNHSERMATATREVEEIGAIVAIDDFGSGTASLSYLRDLGVAGINLDRGFIESARRSGSIAVLKSNITLAKSFGMSTTCKGITDEEDEAIAIQAGCDYLQGFMYGRPEAIEFFSGDLTSSRFKLRA